MDTSVLSTSSTIKHEQPPNIIPNLSSSSATHSSSVVSSVVSSDTDDTDSDQSTTVATRPRLTSRMSSATIIIPRDRANVEARDENRKFAPDDARAMSPRRTSLETERLGEETRRSLRMHARTLQSGLNALAEKIEMVKSDHEKLEKQNLALQDYIGGLTRSMTKTDLTSKSKK